jgi:putative flippase GtrA
MRKKDLGLVTIIGGAVGLLVQPVLTNLGSGGAFSRMLGGAGLTLPVRAAAFVGLLILAPVALTVAAWLGRFVPVIYQFAKFAAVGTLNTVLNFAVLNLLAIISGVNSGPLVAVFAGVAFLIATTNSFFWNKLWTFGSRAAATGREALKFYAITAVGVILNSSAVAVVVNYLRPASVNPSVWLNVGGLAGVAVSFLWNFFGYKFIVFKQPAAGAGGQG